MRRRGAANDIDYAGDFARAKALKKALTTSNISFDTDEARGLVRDAAAAGELPPLSPPPPSRTGLA